MKYYNTTDAEHFRGRSRRGADDPIVIKYAYFMGHEFRDGAPLTNLTAQVDFIASVAAVNNGGVGPESYKVSFKTEARGRTFLMVVGLKCVFIIKEKDNMKVENGFPIFFV